MHRRIAASASLLSLVAMSGCRHFRFPDQPANYREYAYVTSGGNGTVSVLDLVQMRQDRVLQVGANPTGAATSPTRNEVYVVNTGAAGRDGSLSVIDATRNAVTATVPLHERPYQISVDTQGRRGYVANAGSNTVSVVDLVNHRELTTVGTGEEPGLAKISPDGRTLVVSNRKAGSVSLYNVTDADAPQLRATFDGCTGATDIAIIPLDHTQVSTKAFIACSGDDAVLGVSLAQPADSWAARQDGELIADHVLARLRVGKTPVQLAVKPDGGEIFASNFDSGTISEISTWTNEVGGTYRIGMQPSRGLVASDNSTLWIANFGGESLSAYSIDDGRITGSVRTGAGPDVLAMSADEHLLLAGDARSGDVAVIRTRDRNGPTLFTLLPAGAKPNAIVVKAFTAKP
ncbi:YncE family protein [Terriglobus sp.]|uniref:YncE family protein n=1 Tax=Terriglobus sp. TaxID=1889013 RepID=UPI003AFFBF8F